MKIRWLRGGLDVPGIGLTKENKTVSLDKETAESFIKQGLAELANKKIEKTTKVVEKKVERGDK